MAEEFVDRNPESDFDDDPAGGIHISPVPRVVRRTALLMGFAALAGLLPDTTSDTSIRTTVVTEG